MFLAVKIESSPTFGSCCRSTGCFDNVVESSCLDGSWSSSKCSAVQCSNFGSCCTTAGSCLSSITESSCSKINGKFTTGECLPSTCSAPPVINPPTTGACCANQQCTDIKSLNSDSCDIFLLGVTCAEAEVTADSCIQGNCFNKFEQALCNSTTSVCSHGHCVNYSPLPNPLVLTPGQIGLYKFVSEICSTVQFTDSSNTVEGYYRMNLAPTKSLYQKTSIGSASIDLCPSGSVWYIQFTNPSSESATITFITTEIKATEEEQTSDASSLLFTLFLTLFSLTYLLL